MMHEEGPVGDGPGQEAKEWRRGPMHHCGGQLKDDSLHCSRVDTANHRIELTASPACPIAKRAKRGTRPLISNLFQRVPWPEADS
jgi:hypothetical protein